MERNLLILGVLQVVTLFLYGWVGRVFVSQPQWNHPRIFHNAVVRNLLVIGPLVVMVALIVCAFVFTHSPWLFLGLTLAGWVALSPRPSRDLM